MSKQTQHKNIPELRFPEFANDGEWVEKELIDLVDRKVKWSFTGGPFGSNLKASDYTTTGIRIIQLQNIGEGEFNDEYKIYTSIEKADELLSCNIYAGEIILSKMGDPVGRACVIPEKLERCVMASDGIRLVVDEKKNSKYFIYSLINSKQIRESIEKKATGSTRKRIGLDELKKIPLVIPNSQNEQQKIASCLSSLDAVITAHSQKLEALKDHKKGLMQNLFPQEGETEPKYRFPEFVNDGEWDKNALGNLGQFLGGGTPDRSNSDYWIGNIPWISSSDISEDDIHNISISRFINENAVKQSATKIIPQGSILFVSRVGVGKLAINKDDLCTSQDFTNFYSENVLNYFVGYFFSANKHLLQSLNQGTSIKGFSKGDLENFEFIYPKNLKEQQKIASCLSSLDALISSQTEKVEHLNLHKRGLMQGLFPKINE